MFHRAFKQLFAMLFRKRRIFVFPVREQINPRLAGGTPRSFPRIAKKQRGAPYFPQLSWKFCPQVISGRSLVMINWPYLIKSLWCYSSCSFWAINMKRSGYHKNISIHKTFIFDFSFRWPKVRLILWPPYYKAMGEKKTKYLLYASCPVILLWIELC